jgi:hypothetical protein
MKKTTGKRSQTQTWRQLKPVVVSDLFAAGELATCQLHARVVHTRALQHCTLYSTTTCPIIGCDVSLCCSVADTITSTATLNCHDWRNITIQKVLCHLIKPT